VNVHNVRLTVRGSSDSDDRGPQEGRRLLNERRRLPRRIRKADTPLRADDAATNRLCTSAHIPCLKNVVCLIFHNLKKLEPIVITSGTLYAERPGFYMHA